MFQTTNQYKIFPVPCFPPYQSNNNVLDIWVGHRGRRSRQQAWQLTLHGPGVRTFSSFQWGKWWRNTLEGTSFRPKAINNHCLFISLFADELEFQYKLAWGCFWDPALLGTRNWIQHLRNTCISTCSNAGWWLQPLKNILYVRYCGSSSHICSCIEYGCLMLFKKNNTNQATNLNIVYCIAFYCILLPFFTNGQTMSNHKPDHFGIEKNGAHYPVRVVELAPSSPVSTRPGVRKVGWWRWCGSKSECHSSWLAQSST